MHLTSIHGLSVEILENGAVKSINADPVRISLKAGTLFSFPGTNIFLRKRKDQIAFHPLTGPGSQSKFHITEKEFVATGEWSGIEYTCSLQVAADSPGWQWIIDLKNTLANPVEMDLVYVQDVGLKPLDAGLINEYYVAQYLERRILEDETHGAVICCRQNMKEPTGHPWIMIACKNGAASASTDGMQFFGRSYRETGVPEGLKAETFGGEYAGESSVVALQEKPFSLAPGGEHQTIFSGSFMPDHPQATSSEDLKLLQEIDAITLPPVLPSFSPPVLPSYSLTVLSVDDLNNVELDRFFGTDRRHAEEQNGRLLSFFSNENHHVVLKTKEILADRPHAHIMQAKSGFTPDESIMSTTAFMFGVFNSHITQGNTNFNILLSVCTSQFNTDPVSGQRIFVEIGGRWYLLGVPSAFEMGLNHCRWIYKFEGQVFQVRTWTSKMIPQINLDVKVISRGKGGRGEKVRLIITHDFDPLNGWLVYPGSTSRDFIAIPAEGSMISSKFENGRFRFLIQGDNDLKDFFDEGNLNYRVVHDGGLFTLESHKTEGFCMSIIGEVCSQVDAIIFTDADQQFHTDCKVALTEWKDLSQNLVLKSEQEDIAAIREILPWYGMNALTHYLTPYGIEQFGGAAWGTRDVSQGPVDLLLFMEKYDEAREVLRIIFSNQNSDGGWPQWWMFDSYSEIRSDSSHDDIYYWCLIALAGYIKVTGDYGFLSEVLSYYHEKGPDFAEKTPLSEHARRLITMVTGSFIPGTALVPFGGGDWNDSLQPVSKDLASRMISSWTVEMSYQAFSQYLQVYEKMGETEQADELRGICERIKADFNRHLVKDGIVAGYGLVEADRSISVLLHPSDTTTGIHYSILPMERGILSGIFTKEQADYHQDIIEKQLKGPDGARLMDRPLKYRGGIQEIFQRAESSTFFGREIGLMYVHEHIRYAELLARTGKADAFVKALRQAIPVGYREIVTCGDIRQANCYYSSSDVHFRNRYEADERYDEVISGALTLRGGWRVYSSGPGIYIGIIVTRLLGLRVEYDKVIIDPVMPLSFNGLSVSMDLLDHQVTFNFEVKTGNFSPKSISINGNDVAFTLEGNKYRKGGALIRMDDFLELLSEGGNVIQIQL